MRKSFILAIMIAALLSTTANANTSTDVNVDVETQNYEKWLDTGNTKTISTKTETETKTVTTNTNTKTTTTTTTTTTTATATTTTTTSTTTTNTDTNTNNVTNTSTNTSVTSSTNPFSDDNEITNVVSADPGKITDVETAEACGITKIADGFPKAGTVAGVGSDVLRLRSWPWGNIIGKYPLGTAVTILGESGEFYLVEVNGQQGYMHKNYISTSDKAASGVAPYYPGDTRNGGSLSLKDGVQASKDGAEGKVPTTAGSTTTPGAVTITGDKVVLDVPKNYQGTVNTPAPWSSCGPTSLSMILGFYGKGNPTVTVTDIYKISGCTQANGTGHDGLVKAAKKYGMTNAQWHYSVNQNFCRQQLKAGKPLLCHVKGHYVVMKGMDSNGNVILNDPAWKGVERTMSWSDFVAWWKQSNSPMSCMTC